jgi:hypothetical protein
VGTKDHKHELAVETFYHQEAVVLIDFRTALDVIQRVTDSSYIQGDFFCNRDVERLKTAAENILTKMKKTYADWVPAVNHPTEGFPPSH